MNAAIAMQTNAYGQTVLQDPHASRGEHIDVDDSGGGNNEFHPHISSSGEFVHNQSVVNSPTMQRFFDQYAKKTLEQSRDENSEDTTRVSETEHPVNMLNGEHASVSDIDEYAKEFCVQEPELEPVKIPEHKVKRTFAASRSLVRFCTECGFSFNSEKFCPHCGQKRATYSAPNA